MNFTRKPAQNREKSNVSRELYDAAYQAVAAYGEALSRSGKQPANDLQTCYAMLSFLENFQRNAEKGLPEAAILHPKLAVPKPKLLKAKNLQPKVAAPKSKLLKAKKK